MKLDTDRLLDEKRGYPDRQDSCQWSECASFDLLIKINMSLERLRPKHTIANKVENKRA